MKIKSLVIFLLICFPTLCFAQDSIRFREITLAEGLQMAKKENKTLFFMGFASWCEHCKKMKEKIFKDKEVADYYNKHFICLRQDMEKGEGIKLHAKFQVKSFPTFVFLDGDGTTLYQSTGEKNDSGMIALGKNALTETMQYPYLQKEFEKDVTNAEKCFAYLFALRMALLDCSEPAKKHLATQSEAQLLSAMNWKIIANGISDINSREFQFVLSHQKEYATLASPIRVERKIVNMADELLSPYVNRKDSAGYFIRRPQAESMHHPKVDSLLFKFDLDIYQGLQNWKEYEKAALTSVETMAWNSGSWLKEIANNFMIHVSDVNSLLKAAAWAKRAGELNEEYTPYILSTKLYQKAGDNKSALEMAQKGKDLAVKYGFDHKEADNLIQLLER